MNLGTPQIIWLFLVVLGLGMSLAKHGEKRNDKYNFWSNLISSAISLYILYSGGFFG